MEVHEAAALFPLMEDEEYQQLKADIADHGQIEPILVFGGKILDGRNRYRACLELGIEPRCTACETDSPLAMVISLNLKRRHITKSQRAMIALELETWFAKQAETRKGGRPEKLSQKIDQVSRANERRASDQAGHALQVNRQYVADAKKLKTDHPKIAEQVKQGKLSLQDAKREAKRETQRKKAENNPIPREEQQLIDKLKSGVAVVVNLQTQAHVVKWASDHGRLVIVDRTSKWGNPFILDADGTREEVVEKYGKYYLPHKPSLLKDLPSLTGKALGCHCAPLPCHADCLAGVS